MGKQSVGVGHQLPLGAAMKSTPAQRAHLRRYWHRRASECRAARLCVRCMRAKVGPGEATCELCKQRIRLVRKLREMERDHG